jgi:hypothetical protein
MFPVPEAIVCEAVHTVVRLRLQAGARGQRRRPVEPALREDRIARGPEF